MVLFLFGSNICLIMILVAGADVRLKPPSRELRRVKCYRLAGKSGKLGPATETSRFSRFSHTCILCKVCTNAQKSILQCYKIYFRVWCINLVILINLKSLHSCFVKNNTCVYCAKFAQLCKNGMWTNINTILKCDIYKVWFLVDLNWLHILLGPNF